MQRQYVVHAVHNAVLDHGFRAARELLSGLKQQPHHAGERALPVFQQLGEAQQHCGVGIVSTGVHILVCGGKIQASLLLNGERIHISPHRNGQLPRPPDIHDQPGMRGKLPVCQAHFTQLFFDIGFRFRELQSDLRNLMQLPPPTLNNRLKIFRILIRRLHYFKHSNLQKDIIAI